MQLSEKYRITTDDNNVVLQFYEVRERQKKDGTIEMHEHTENLYYPTIRSALKSFVQKELKHSTSIDDCLKRIDALERLIDTLKFNLVK